MIANKPARSFTLLLVGLSILISLVTIALLLADLSKARSLFEKIHIQGLILLLALAITDHVVRYWRWDALLRKINPNESTWRRFTSLLLFSAGSLLIFTPARAGEIAKGLYARDYLGIPLSSSIPILVAERIIDIGVMVILSTVGLILKGEETTIWVVIPMLGGLGLVISMVLPKLSRTVRIPLLLDKLSKRFGESIRLANESRRLLMSPKVLSINLGLGFIAWTIETFIYLTCLATIGVSIDLPLVAVALAIFPLASLSGSISFLPGGIGVTEGSLTALGIIVGGLNGETALIAALLSRAVIFSAVILIGLVALAILHTSNRPTLAQQ